MAKTSKARSRAAAIPVGRQAPNDVWSPKDLLAALRAPSPERKQELLREGGILNSKGKLAKKYRSWGNRVSRTAFAISGK